jgi:hypothetical protein
LLRAVPLYGFRPGLLMFTSRYGRADRHVHITD